MVVLLSSEMDPAGLERTLAPFRQTRRGSRHLFFEELWVVELVLH
jgi:hypothetical protein